MKFKNLTNISEDNNNQAYLLEILLVIRKKIFSMILDNNKFYDVYKDYNKKGIKYEKNVKKEKILMIWIMKKILSKKIKLKLK